MLRFCLLTLVFALAGASLSVAQPSDTTSPADSLQEYDLGEVVVGSGAERRVAPSTLQRIPLAAIDRLDAVTVDAAVRLIPAAHVQTNSRGETLLYLRAAGERQTALFFDGALLNIPWDNRIDLGLVPSSVVGGITVAKGVPSVLWGANVLGGAVNIVSRSLLADGLFSELTVQAGTGDFRQQTVTMLGRQGSWSFAGSSGLAERDGFMLPNAADLPFSQNVDGLRTNTDFELSNLFGRVAYEFSPRARVGISVIRTGGSKGIAPEGHLDPSVERVRYWRYPDWRLTMGILSGEAGLGVATTVRASTWASLYDQTISSYTNAAYDARESVQLDDDRTAGARVLVEHAFASATLRFGVNALISAHDQRESEEVVPVTSYGPTLTFQQGLYSAGVEAEASPVERLTVTIGASLDALTTPETGDKPARDAFTDYGLTSGAVYQLDEAWALNAAVGRKTRFPTLRELFGEALNRFVVNPDLRPESSLLAEVGARREGDIVSGEVTAFLNRTSDTIDQRTLEDGRRQRVNLGSGRVLGIEIAGAVRTGPRVRLDGHLAVMDIRGFEADGTPTRLAEKPQAIGRFAVTYNPGLGPNATLEAVYTGVAYSPAGPDRFARLDPALVFNLRVAVRSPARWLGVSGEVFARANNVTDAVVLPQLGLPGPGREFQVGVKLAI